MPRTASESIRLAVFASGGGSNFQSIVDAVERGDLGLDVALLLSNRPDAGALKRAAKHHIPTAVLDPTDFADEPTYVRALLDTLRAHGVNFIALAGYMRLIPSDVVTAFRGRMVNIHPALLPAFGGKGMYGKRVHRAVIDHGAKWTGVTIHFVDEQYDTGPILAQRPVPVEEADTPETLAERVLEAEHALYPEALRLLAEGRVRIEGRRVRILAE